MLVLGLSGFFTFEAADIFVSHVLAAAAFEARYLGVRQFLGLGRPRRVTLLPHVMYLAVLVVFLRDRPGIGSAVNVRLIAVHLLLAYIGARTAWSLYRRRIAGLTREIRFLGAVAAVTVVASLAQAGIIIAHPIHGDIFAGGVLVSWFFLILNGLAIAWSVASLGVSCAWIERQLQEREEQFRLMLDGSPLPTMVLATNGSFERVNRKFVESSGYALRDIPDEEHWFALACPDPEQRAAARGVWREAIQQATMNAQAEPVGEMLINYRDAPSRTVEVHARRIDTRMVVQLVDVTELKAAVQAREELVAVVSHDLKSPLNSIQLRAEVAIQDSSQERLTNQLRAIRRAASNMERIVRELLDAVSVESGGLELELAPTSVDGLVASVVDVESPVTATRSLKLETDVGRMPEVLCDRERLTRVLINLIDNAIKFTKEGTITIHAEARAGEVLLSVTDTGRGISPEVLPHIFDRYFTTTPGGRGTGIGLYVAKEIIEAHGGRIWATSEPGHGSTFSFTLPRTPDDERPAVTA
jgi:PAS domain S-box-containing protein